MSETLEDTLFWDQLERNGTCHGVKWFFLCDQGEDMRKWDGKPTDDLEARVHELKKKMPKRNVTPVSSEEFSRQGRWNSHPSLTDSNKKI